MPRRRNRKATSRNRSRHREYANVVAGLLSPFDGDQSTISPIFTPLPNRGNRVSFTYKKLYPITTNASGHAVFGFRPSPHGMNNVCHQPTETTPGLGDFVLNYTDDVLGATATDHLGHLLTISAGLHYIPTSPDNVAGTIVTINEQGWERDFAQINSMTYTAGDLNRGANQHVTTNREFTALCRVRSERSNTLHNSADMTNSHTYGGGFAHGEVVLQFLGPASTVVGYVAVACRVDGYYRLNDGNVAAGMNYISTAPMEAPHRAVTALYKYSSANHPMILKGPLDSNHRELREIVSKHTGKLVNTLLKQGGAAAAAAVTAYFTESPQLSATAYNSTLALENAISVD